MSIKYNNILDTVEDDGVKIASYYGKFLVNSYEEAFKVAKEMDFAGGVREEGKEYGMMFNSKEEFDKETKDKTYPLAIVPLV